jgi:hypothetical protein
MLHERVEDYEFSGLDLIEREIGRINEVSINEIEKLIG